MSAKVLANLLGTTPSYGTSDFLGYIPDLPEISAQTEQKKAIAGNIAALPEATQLAAGINKFNFQQLQDMLKAAIPITTRSCKREESNSRRCSGVKCRRMFRG